MCPWPHSWKTVELELRPVDLPPTSAAVAYITASLVNSKTSGVMYCTLDAMYQICVVTTCPVTESYSATVW